MWLTFFGIVMLSSDEQPENASAGMTVTSAGIFTLLSAAQPENTFSPSVLRPSGSVISASAAQPEKVNASSFAMLLGSVMRFKAAQFSNALLPIAVTESGMTRLSSFEQSLNAPPAMATVPLGTV